MENGNGEFEKYFGKHLNLIETKGMGKGCVVAILWCVPFIGFALGDIAVPWFFVWFIIAIIASYFTNSSIAKYEQPLDDEILELTKKFDKDCEKQMRRYLKKVGLEKDNLNNVLLVKSKHYLFNKNIIQYAIDNNKLKLTCLPVENISFQLSSTNSEIYAFKVWNKNQEVKPIELLKENILNFTYHGTEIINIDGSGNELDVGGAIIGGVLFGGVGALLGGKTATKVTSTKEDLREVQINTVDNKTIIVKGFDLYQDLINYFPDKELNNVSKESKAVKKTNKSVDSLKQLKEMLDGDLITQAEYDKKKEEILSKLN